MSYVFRLILAAILLSVACAAFGLFEYWKLLEPDNRYLIAALASLGALSLGVSQILPIEGQGFSRCFSVGLTIAIMFGCADLFYLKKKEREDIHRVLASHARCESVLAQVLDYPYKNVYQSAMEACVFRTLEENLKNASSIDEGEREIRELAAALDSAGRFNGVALVTLITDYTDFESSQVKRLGNAKDSDLDRLQSDFALLEGQLQILDFYHVSSMNLNSSPEEQEDAEIRKLSEISTVGKVVKMLVHKQSVLLDGYQWLLNEYARNHLEPPGELTLLQIRVQKIQQSFDKTFRRLALKNQLNSLGIQARYPAQYQQVLQNVEFPGS